MNGKLLLLIGFCLLALSQGLALKEDKEEPEAAGAEDKQDAKVDKAEEVDEKEKANAEEEKEEAPAAKSTEETNEEEGSGDKENVSDDVAPFACNLKFKRVGCYADKGKKERPLRSFIMSDADLSEQTKKGKVPQGDKFNGELPKFACKCANESINDGNAVFGIQNLAECWTGPDDSKYDKDGASNDCVTFDYAPCAESAEICAGKKHSNFVYYVDSEDHTKSKDEIKKEFKEYNVKVAKWRKEQAKKAKAKALKAKKAKKGKKAKKE